jgi:hypothetical protein
MSWLQGLISCVSGSVACLAVGWFFGRKRPADPDARLSRYMHRREPLLVWGLNLNLLLLSPLIPWDRTSLPWRCVAVGLGSLGLAMTLDSAWLHRNDGPRKELLMFAGVPAALWSGAWLLLGR